jgi:hypothetical protein
MFCHRLEITIVVEKRHAIFNALFGELWAEKRRTPRGLRRLKAQ